MVVATFFTADQYCVAGPGSIIVAGYRKYLIDHSISYRRIFCAGKFKKDAYPDRGTVVFWTEFSFPFWFTDILSSLDSLSFLGFKMQEPQIKKAIDWLIKAQQENGLWNVHLVRGKDKDLNLWIALAICRVFKRFCLN